jgi:hypothetical protein
MNAFLNRTFGWIAVLVLGMAVFAGAQEEEAPEAPEKKTPEQIAQEEAANAAKFVVIDELKPRVVKLTIDKPIPMPLGDPINLEDDPGTGENEEPVEREKIEVDAVQISLKGRVKSLPDEIFIYIKLAFNGKQIDIVRTTPNESKFDVVFGDYVRERVCPGNSTVELEIKKGSQILPVQKMLAENFSDVRMKMDVALGNEGVIRETLRNYQDGIVKTVKDCRDLYDEVHNRGMKQLRKLQADKQADGEVKESNFNRARDQWMTYGKEKWAPKYNDLRGRWQQIHDRFFATPYPDAVSATNTLVSLQEQLWKSYLRLFYEISGRDLPSKLMAAPTPQAMVGACQNSGEKVTNGLQLKEPIWVASLLKDLPAETGSISEEGHYKSDISGFEIPIPTETVGEGENAKKIQWAHEFGGANKPIRLSMFYPNDKMALAMAQVEIHEVEGSTSKEETIQSWRDLILREWPNAQIMVEAELPQDDDETYAYQVEFRAKDKEKGLFLRVGTVIYFKKDAPQMAYGLVYTSTFAQLFNEFSAEWEKMIKGMKIN